jgi:hypothetical protein
MDPLTYPRHTQSYAPTRPLGNTLTIRARIHTVGERVFWRHTPACARPSARPHCRTSSVVPWDSLRGHRNKPYATRICEAEIVRHAKGEAYDYEARAC